MVRLGDAFPDDDKQDFITRQLVPGQVLYLFCDFTRPPKEKYALVAAVEPTPLLFLINSTIAAFIRSSAESVACQVALSAVDYDFLSHDSFIDCSQVFDCMTRIEIMGQLGNDVSRVKGTLTQSASKAVLSAVAMARTISGAHKRAIQQALKAQASP